MSRKLAVSAVKLKNKPDSRLARAHKKGARIELVQPAVDKKWGRFYFNHYKRFYLLLVESQRQYEETIKVLANCRRIEVDELRGNRHVDDDLRNDLELHSMLFLMLLKMGFEYLTLEMLPTINQIKTAKDDTPKIEWDKFELNERIPSLLKSLNLNVKVPKALIDFLGRRDIVEHPTQDRLYNASENGWKNNHLAWVLSGELEDKFDDIVVFVNEIAQTFERYVEMNPIPGKLEGLSRGIKAAEPYKKTKPNEK